MPNLTASIPHQLTRAEAKERIQEQIRVMRQQHSSTFSEVQENWTGDTLAFAVRAMGQSISGQIVVEDQMVHLTVVLPWFLKMLAGSIQKQLEHQGRLLLEPPRK